MRGGELVKVCSAGVTGVVGGLLLSSADSWETVRLALGAFLTSSGFGGVAAFGAALIAYRGIRARVDFDRGESLDLDSRERWWETTTWLYDHRKKMSDDEIEDSLVALKELATTKGQYLMLGMITQTILVPDEDGDDD